MARAWAKPRRPSSRGPSKAWTSCCRASACPHDGPGRVIAHRHLGTGLGLARNRRVEIFRFIPPSGRKPVPQPPSPPTTAPGGSSSPIGPAADTPDLSAAFEQNFEVNLGTLRTSYVLVDAKPVGKLKVRVRGR